MRRCGRCKRKLPVDQFSKDRSQKDGLAYACRDCKRDYKRDWARRNREHLAQKQREWRDANTDYMDEWRSENAEHEQQYRRDHPEIWWRSSYRHRMTTRYGFEPGETEDFTKADVIAAYGDKCWHCGGPFEELDHFPIPLSKRGPHTLANVRPACTRCNRTSWKEAQ